MDFIGPLSVDNRYDCILTMTDRLGGADIWLLPTRTTI
jgi:transposase InsO family protein